VCASSGIGRTAEDAGANPHGAPGDIDLTDRVEAAEVDDDTASHGAARHSASRSARDEWNASRSAPANESRDVVRIDRNRDGGGNRASDPGAFGVDRPCE
jgi:hypothetical protein